ncbi:choice-of-anchor P family protein [Streptomyces sp. NPDC050433]|uniref:choice-of-anchor P family protein n=1 Tax=Streptomyces sp. NPDC050433 TaxID=3365615 RepID=UPI0037B7907A
MRDGRSPSPPTGTSSIANARVGVPGLPVIEVSGLTATSTSSCPSKAGTTKLTLTVAGTPVTIPDNPNHTIDLGVAKHVTNEQTERRRPTTARPDHPKHRSTPLCSPTPQGRRAQLWLYKASRRRMATARLSSYGPMSRRASDLCASASPTAEANASRASASCHGSPRSRWTAAARRWKWAASSDLPSARYISPVPLEVPDRSLRELSGTSGAPLCSLMMCSGYGTGAGRGAISRAKYEEMSSPIS